MTHKPPPVPSANKTPKGPGAAPEVDTDDRRPSRPDNLAEQDRQGNIAQNTHHQGYQQDR